MLILIDKLWHVRTKLRDFIFPLKELCLLLHQVFLLVLVLLEVVGEFIGAFTIFNSVANVVSAKFNIPIIGIELVHLKGCTLLLLECHSPIGISDTIPVNFEEFDKVILYTSVTLTTLLLGRVNSWPLICTYLDIHRIKCMLIVIDKLWHGPN